MVIFPAISDAPLSAKPEAVAVKIGLFGKVNFVVVGLLLLAAASLKLLGMSISPFAQYGWLLTPTVQTVAVVWEVTLGIWLILNRSRFSAWLAALGTFFAFAGVSGYLGFLGQTNCGCFGLIQASPWAAFAVDLGALALLGFSKPQWSGWGFETPAMKWLGRIGIVTLLFFGTIAALFGSLDRAIALVNRESLFATPALLDFGEGSLRDVGTRTLTIENLTDSPIRLIGGTSDCSCVAVRDLPVTIPPKGKIAVNIELTFAGSQDGFVTRSAEFYTDDPKQPRLPVLLHARIRKALPQPVPGE